MSTTLVVSYLPRGNNSNTKKLLDHFLAKSEGKTTIDHLDLINESPDMMIQDNLFAYMKRAFMGQELDLHEKALMGRADHLTQKLINANNIVIATPVHNFSVPGIVKVWLDNVVQKGLTFDFGANGAEGLMKGKSALVLYSAGFWYSDSPQAYKLDWNTLPEVMNANLSYMGYEPVDIIGVDGINAKPKEEVDMAFENAYSKIDEVTAKWFTV